MKFLGTGASYEKIHTFLKSLWCMSTFNQLDFEFWNGNFFAWYTFAHIHTAPLTISMMAPAMCYVCDRIKLDWFNCFISSLHKQIIPNPVWTLGRGSQIQIGLDSCMEMWQKVPGRCLKGLGCFSMISGMCLEGVWNVIGSFLDQHGI